MQHVLANLFISEIIISDAGLLTVTKVKVSDDLKIAKIYLSFLENKKTVEELLEIIKSKHDLIRHHVSLNITLKYTPRLRFYHDDSIEHALRIDKLIQKIHNDD